MKTEYIILCENRGDFITQLKFEPTGDFEIHGGPAENAIRYTLEQATSLVEEMGRGYAIEPAPQTVIDEINRLDQQKTTYTLSEIEQYADSYTDDDGEEVVNYNLPGGWQVGCVIPGTMTPGSAWTAVKNTATETLERCIQIK